jgi:hypothetical protein
MADTDLRPPAILATQSGDPASRLAGRSGESGGLATARSVLGPSGSDPTDDT